MFYVVNIGRNVGNEPMSQFDWTMFQLRTFEVLERYGKVVGSGKGSSEWDGIRESFVTYHVLIEETNTLAVASRLSRLASAFDQEAIAFIPSSESCLVGPAK